MDKASTTAGLHGWDLDALAELLPYMKMTAANDARAGRHYRLDLSLSAPWALARKALDFTAPCANCRRSMHPFRQRTHALPRGGGISKGTIYLSVSCPLSDRVACSRGRDASIAYDELEALITEAKGDGFPQAGLAGIAPVPSRPPEPLAPASETSQPHMAPTSCPNCGQRLISGACAFCGHGFRRGGRSRR